MTRCRCGLDTEPPIMVTWWRPDLDDDPGEDPEIRRAVRVPGGWEERGLLVDFYNDLTPPLPWSRVGRCWANNPHPVTAQK
jgi:hypothetical protein